MTVWHNKSDLQLLSQCVSTLAQLSKQTRPWDTEARCRDLHQSTNNISSLHFTLSSHSHRAPSPLFQRWKKCAAGYRNWKTTTRCVDTLFNPPPHGWHFLLTLSRVCVSVHREKFVSLSLSLCVSLCLCLCLLACLSASLIEYNFFRAPNYTSWLLVTSINTEYQFSDLFSQAIPVPQHSQRPKSDA